MPLLPFAVLLALLLPASIESDQSVTSENDTSRARTKLLNF